MMTRDFRAVYEYTKFESLLPNFEGHRVRIVYDSSLVKDLLVLQHVIPHFVSKLKTYLVLYSEALYHKYLKRVFHLLKVKPDLEDALNDLNIIKIGIKDDVAYGNLACFIEQGELDREFESLLEYLRKIDENSVLILYGSVEYFLTGIKDKAFKRLVDLFSVLPERITLFGFRHRLGLKSLEVLLLSELYDIVVEVWRDENSLDDAFNFTVEYQCGEGTVYGRFKMRDGLLVSMG